MADQDLNILLRLKDQASSQLKGFGGRVDTVKGKLESIRLPLLAVGGVLTGLGVASVNSASNLGESLNKANEVFGESVGVIHAFAEDSARSFGISQRAASEYTGTLGTILNASGLAQDASAGMSVEMVKLAADLASFNNIPIDVALEKLRSGLVGEVEPLRTVGVLLNASAVEARAMELGLVDASGELSEAAKVQARYALILERTQTAQGDFTHTSGDLANQMRIIQAMMENLSAQVGQVLLPVATQLIGVVNQVVGVFMGLPAPVKTGIVVLGGITAAIAALGLAIPPLIGGVSAMMGAITALRAGMLALHLSMGPVTLVVLGISAAIAAGILIWKNWGSIIEWFKATWTQVWTTVQTVFSNVTGAIVRAYTSGWGWLLPGGPLVKAIQLLKAVWDANFETIRQIFERVVGAVSTAYRNTLVPVFDLIQRALDVVRGAWDAAWDAMRAKFVSMWNGLTAVVRPVANTIIGFINRLIEGWNGLRFSIPARTVLGVEVFPGIDIGVPQVPRIPSLAQGGIVTGPTLAMIGDNPTRREAVVPLPANGIGGVTVVINGNVYGMDDFERQVAAAVRNVKRRGGLAFGV